MKISHYSLIIRYPRNTATADAVSDILNVTPTDVCDTTWELLTVEQDQEDYQDFINFFLAILDGKYEQLEEIGVMRENINILATYEYNGQCNTEFTPEEMLKLGSNGIALGVTCWSNPDLPNS